MKVTILDDTFDTLRTFPCFAKLSGHEVVVWTDHVDDVEVLARRLADTDALVLIRERTAVRAPLLDALPPSARGVPRSPPSTCSRRSRCRTPGTGCWPWTAPLHASHRLRHHRGVRASVRRDLRPDRGLRGRRAHQPGGAERSACMKTALGGTTVIEVGEAFRRLAGLEPDAQRDGRRTVDR